jgi:predicted enzyme related to lactoylglutathione lyase
MLKLCLLFGSIAGIVVGVPLFVLTVAHIETSYGMLIGYLTMLIALSAVFAAIKRYRDQSLGGVIRFWPALALGLGISVVAGLFYVAAWEAALAVSHLDFADTYAKAQLAQRAASGASEAELQRLSAEMDEFRANYAKPLYRLAMTFAEIFPVGVLVSLISAGLLRNSRFLPARKLALAIPLLLLSAAGFADTPPTKILYVGSVSINPCQEAKILAEWYARLGIETKAIQGGYYRQIETAAGPLFFGIHPAKASQKCGGNVAFVFRVEDYPASLSAAQAKGLTPDSTEKDEQGQFAHFHDPDGNEVTLWGN